MSFWRVVVGDALERLRELEDGSVQTCVTSPPYFGLRDYGDEGQLGLEATPDEYVARLVDVFREVRRVLRDDGTLWLNLGDSYYSPTATQGRNESKSTHSFGDGSHGPDGRSPALDVQTSTTYRRNAEGVKPKDLLGIPWMVAFALRADGWYLRSDIVWAKPNPMPESVTDRPTKAHEYVFLLSKSPRYFYDADAVREDATEVGIAREGRARDTPAHSPPGTQPNRRSTSNGDADWLAAGRNKRSVWTVATQPFPGAHFAVFPPKLIEPCVKAGSAEDACGVCGAPWQRVVADRGKGPEFDPLAITKGGALPDGPGIHRNMGGRYQAWLDENPRHTVGFEPSCDHQDKTGTSVVLDPFSGAGTTGLVATRLGRSYVGIELNPAYAEMARERIRDDAPLMNYLIETM